MAKYNGFMTRVMSHFLPSKSTPFMCLKKKIKKMFHISLSHSFYVLINYVPSFFHMIMARKGFEQLNMLLISIFERID